MMVNKVKQYFILKRIPVLCYSYVTNYCLCIYYHFDTMRYNAFKQWAGKQESPCPAGCPTPHERWSEGSTAFLGFSFFFFFGGWVGGGVMSYKVNLTAN